MPRLLGLVPTSQEGNYRRECTKRRREGGRREGAREEATERGIVSSHCSIKSVGNDQDEMMAMFLYRY